jgi:hypothetical protein
MSRRTPAAAARAARLCERLRLELAWDAGDGEARVRIVLVQRPRGSTRAQLRLHRGLGRGDRPGPGDPRAGRSSDPGRNPQRQQQSGALGRAGHRGRGTGRARGRRRARAGGRAGAGRRGRIPMRWRGQGVRADFDARRRSQFRANPPAADAPCGFRAASEDQIRNRAPLHPVSGISPRCLIRLLTPVQIGAPPALAYATPTPARHWPGKRLIVEIDSLAHHGDARAFEGDRRRDAALVAAGYRVIRVTWTQLVRERDQTLGRVAAALAV